MSAADRRSGRIRRREEDESDSQIAESAQSGLRPNNEAVSAAITSSQADSSATGQPQSLFAGVQPLPEQMRKRPRRSPRLSSPLSVLAVVELQLVLQFLDAKSKLKAARCSRRLLQAASAPFAWRSAAPFTVEVPSPANVERIGSSLLRFAPIHLRCVWLESLQCAATVPHLAGLELLETPESPADDLSQLLQHPSLARLQLLRLDDESSRLLTVDTMRLVARLPQLRTFNVIVPQEADGAALLQPLADAPALTDLTIRAELGEEVDVALLAAISGCTGLHRLSLHSLTFSSGTFIALCSSPNVRRLQHLELCNYFAAARWIENNGLPDADEYGAAFSALQQLQSLTLKSVFGINTLLPYLHHAPALRLLSIRCEPDCHTTGTADSPLPSRAVLSALLAAAPQLEVRLLMPASVKRGMALGQSLGPSRTSMWQELYGMVAELDRVTIVDEEPSDA